MAAQIGVLGETIKKAAQAISSKADDIVSVAGVKSKSEKLDKKTLLGYWNIRGLVGYLRLMLEYCNEPYEQKTYMCPDLDSMEKLIEMRSKQDGCEWYAEKFNTGMDFPNIPYLYIDGFKISQSRSILRYLARKHSLEGKTEQAKLDTDVVDETLKDFLMDFARVIYFTPKPFYQTERQHYTDDTLAKNLGQLSKFMQNRKYIAGDYVTYCDFPLYEYLDIQRMFAPEAVSKFKNLMKYLERIEELPAVKKYMQSDRFVRAPISLPIALWNGTARHDSSLDGTPLQHDGGDRKTLSSLLKKEVASLNLTAEKVDPSMATSFSD